jgi:gamma-glutamyltranspeptidase
VEATKAAFRLRDRHVADPDRVPVPVAELLAPDHLDHLARGIDPDRAGEAVMAKILGNEKAAAALADTGPGRVPMATANAPDLQKEAAKPKA